MNNIQTAPTTLTSLTIEDTGFNIQNNFSTITLPPSEFANFTSI